MSYKFPIGIDLKWPRLIEHSSIRFPLMQVHSGTQTQNISIQNPSESPILMQIMLLSRYPQPEKLLEFIETEPRLFGYPEYKYLLNKSNESSSLFKLSSNTNKRNEYSREQFKQLNVQPNEKDSLVIFVQPGQTVFVQLEFRADRVGEFDELLIIRNNLTIIEVQPVRVSVGTAELRINNLPPMRSSLFFNELQQTPTAFNTHLKTSDVSNLIMQMNDEDFEHCKAGAESAFIDFDNERFTYKRFLDEYNQLLSRMSQSEERAPTVKLDTNVKHGVDVVFMSQDLRNDQGYKSSFKSKEGVVLRAYLVLKNIGSIELTVLNVLFDGDSCFSRGIEVTYCQPFTIRPHDLTAAGNESTFLLEVRYRPDFTMDLIRKSLVLETNIGDLAYAIEIRIPKHMLSECHDSLPRPPIESYLYYVGLFLILVLVCVMLLTSWVESRSIIKYQHGVYRQLYSLSEKKECVDPDTLANHEYADCSKVKAAAVTNLSPKALRNKKASQNQMPAKKPQTSSHNHRNLLKSLSSTRVNNPNSDSSVSSCSSTYASIQLPKKTTIQASPKPKIEPVAPIQKPNGPAVLKCSSETVNATTSPGLEETDTTIQVKPVAPLDTAAHKTKTKCKPEVECPQPAKKANKTSGGVTAQNESMAAHRKSYLNQQKTQPTKPALVKSMSNENGPAFKSGFKHAFKAVDVGLTTNSDDEGKKIKLADTVSSIASGKPHADSSMHQQASALSYQSRMELDLLHNQLHQFTMQKKQLEPALRDLAPSVQVSSHSSSSSSASSPSLACKNANRQSKKPAAHVSEHVSEQYRNNHDWLDGTRQANNENSKSKYFYIFFFMIWFIKLNWICGKHIFSKGLNIIYNFIYLNVWYLIFNCRSIKIDWNINFFFLMIVYLEPK